MFFLKRAGFFDRKLMLKALGAGFILAMVGSVFPFAAAAAQVPREVIRLHIVANSDREEDQQAKLRVRDAVLEEAEKWYEGAADREEANFLLCTHMEALIRAAEGELAGEYGAHAEMVDMYFPTREYESFSLPAGKYRTLRITLGEGEGKNWWCVVFPALCLPAAQGDVLAQLGEAERELVENPGKYRVKFQVVEWYERLAEMFS